MLAKSACIMLAVHPRGRGEHVAQLFSKQNSDGSSPRARGTRTATSEISYGVRFIPAGAGNTPPPAPAPAPAPVHPRGRGEHEDTAGGRSAIYGSSPRARGTLMSPPTPRARCRFIPAGAGNTFRESQPARRQPVHPRGRGEHGAHQQRANADGGSSPRARGTHGGDRADLADHRFIPAGAGNTAAYSSQAGDQSVHPRGRGEHRSTLLAMALVSGSSPRARGTLKVDYLLLQFLRFIPAGAGNTILCWYASATPTVHPRGRGEHIEQIGKMLGNVGSSPRARGTRSIRQMQHSQSRFIPAGAGNTQRGSDRRLVGAVHPRGRGEHERKAMPEFNTHGSSPRARGTHPPHGRRHALERFIPAGAGNTRSYGQATAPSTVHPRGRGEHIAWKRSTWEGSGSSPRARGTRGC